jgi:hypothetical protein
MALLRFVKYACFRFMFAARFICTTNPTLLLHRLPTVRRRTLFFALVSAVPYAPETERRVRRPTSHHSTKTGIAQA